MKKIYYFPIALLAILLNSCSPSSNDPTEVTALERAGDLRLDLGTQRQRETFSSIVILVQTYLSKIVAWSYHYTQPSHALFPLFYQTIEASHTS